MELKELKDFDSPASHRQLMNSAAFSLILAKMFPRPLWPSEEPRMGLGMFHRHSIRLENTSDVFR